MDPAGQNFEFKVVLPGFTAIQLVLHTSSPANFRGRLYICEQESEECVLYHAPHMTSSVIRRSTFSC